jgi:hypothetical protein
VKKRAFINGATPINGGPESEGKMAWYWWLIAGWVLCGFVALAMEFRDNAAMRENVGWAEVWPTILGPLWLFLKLWEWVFVGREAR